MALCSTLAMGLGKRQKIPDSDTVTSRPLPRNGSKRRGRHVCFQVLRLSWEMTCGDKEEASRPEQELVRAQSEQPPHVNDHLTALTIAYMSSRKSIEAWVEDKANHHITRR